MSSVSCEIVSEVTFSHLHIADAPVSVWFPFLCESIWEACEETTSMSAEPNGIISQEACVV